VFEKAGRNVDAGGCPLVVNGVCVRGADPLLFVGALEGVRYALRNCLRSDGGTTV
jgi:hypothetical protein